MEMYDMEWAVTDNDLADIEYATEWLRDHPVTIEIDLCGNVMEWEVI